ncbi:alpha/beta fold hydrolase [Halopiger goleimassiliensis]|uniref:alpha/beta fold hydrolase n=1 Tax=Halopiger goleimassiliensis TaxID=1293048 RepID=UPI000677A89D|nr:alpha/beta hydrolase [Halopiger goleimassiliensis]
MGSADAVIVLETESGTLPGGYPYASVGDGSRALVVLPGFEDSMFAGVYPPGSGWALVPYVGRFLESHSVSIVSRPRGLPADYDEETAADGHARSLEALAKSAAGVDLVGFSMGGLVGQALARRHPDLVDRLVLANSACRIDDDALDDVRTFERYARRRDWSAIRSKLVADMFADGRAVAYPPWLLTIGQFLQPRPADPDDVLRSLEFIRSFDGCDALGDVHQPTLVFGGERDPYFTPDRTRETAAGIPNAELELVPGAKHGAYHERKRTFDERVSAFLERTDRLVLEH